MSVLRISLTLTNWIIVLIKNEGLTITLIRWFLTILCMIFYHTFQLNTFIWLVSVLYQIYQHVYVQFQVVFLFKILHLIRHQRLITSIYHHLKSNRNKRWPYYHVQNTHRSRINQTTNQRCAAYPQKTRIDYTD